MHTHMQNNNLNHVYIGFFHTHIKGPHLYEGSIKAVESCNIFSSATYQNAVAGYKNLSVGYLISS